MNYWLTGAACALFLTSGCVVDGHHDHGPVSDGAATLSVDWTVDGTTDPSQCRQASAPSILITLEDDSGPVGDDIEVDCEEFGVDIKNLDPGHYYISAVLLDPNGDDRTTTVDSDRFTLYGGDDLPIDIDFPASSFF
jgi:hypothetical protein